MKRIILIMAALAALYAVPVAAQQAPPSSTTPRSGRGLLAGITLTAQQQKQVDSIWAAHAEYREAMRSTRQPGQARDTARVRETNEIRDRMHQQLRTVLTPSQQKLFDRNLEQRSQRRPGAGARRGGPGSGKP